MEKAVTNAGRQIELDVAKFIAIVFMILVHCYDYSPLNVSLDTLTPGGSSDGSVWGTLIAFLGAQPAAPVFMFCMGVGLVYTRHNSPSEMARRGLKLLLTGYLLNLYRTVFVAGGALAGFVGGSTMMPLICSFLLCVDILLFAGLAFLFFALMKRIGVSHLATSLIVAILLVVSQYMPMVADGHQWYCYLIGLFWYQCDFTSFPLMQWLPFPMAGVVFGTMLKQTADKRQFYMRTLGLGLLAMLISTTTAWIMGRSFHAFFTTDYFDMDVLQTVWSLAIVLTLLPMYYFVTSWKQKESVGKSLSLDASKIRKFYVWHWVISGLWYILASVLSIYVIWKIFSHGNLSSLISYFNTKLLYAVLIGWLALTIISVGLFTIRTLRFTASGGLVTFCSRNINKIYLWQWIIITPLSMLSFTVIPVDAYWKLIIEALVVFSLSISIVHWRSCKDMLNEHYKNIHQQINP